MGLLDKIKNIFRKEEEATIDLKTEPGVTYVLKKKLPHGGWKKIAEYDTYVSPDDVIADLPPGVYRLDKHVKGKRGFEVAWGPIAAYDTEDELEELEELVGEKPVRKNTKNENPQDAIESLKQITETLKAQAQVLQELGEIGVQLAKFSGKNVVVLEGNKTFEDLVIEGLMAMRQKYEELDRIFGTSKLKGGEAELPIEGKIPAWAVYAPKMLNQLLDGIEVRLQKWGLLEEPNMMPRQQPMQRQEPKVSDFPDISKYKKKYSSTVKTTEVKEEPKVETKIETIKEDNKVQIDKIEFKDEGEENIEEENIFDEIEFIGEENE